MELTLRHVTVLSAIEEAGSINRASAGLGMSQPALSAQLRRIERALGEPVFERTADGVVVTRFGRRVLSHARAAQAAMTRLQGEARPQGVPTAVRVGGLGPLLLALVERLTEPADAPVTVTARADRSSRVLAAELDQGQVDFAVLREYPGHEIARREGVRQRVLTEHEPVFVGMARTHPLAGAETVDLAWLRDELWAMDPDDDSGELDLLRAACAEHGYEPRWGLISSDNGVARSYVGSGRGVALFEARARHSDDLVVRPLRGDPVDCRMVLRWRAEAEQVLPAEPVVQALLQVYEEAALRQPVYRAWRERRSLQSR